MPFFGVSLSAMAVLLLPLDELVPDPFGIGRRDRLSDRLAVIRPVDTHGVLPLGDRPLPPTVAVYGEVGTLVPDTVPHPRDTPPVRLVRRPLRAPTTEFEVTVADHPEAEHLAAQHHVGPCSRVLDHVRDSAQLKHLQYRGVQVRVLVPEVCVGPLADGR